MGSEPVMPWSPVSLVGQRVEFCELALKRVVPFRELAARYEISPKTGYKWLARYEAEGVGGLVDRSRAPLVSPFRTSKEIEEKVCEIRDEHPWGGRKIRWRLIRDGVDKSLVPAPSTITDILRRNNRLGVPVPDTVVIRFESDKPNDTWQMDFKGNFDTQAGRCDPFDVLDDHSRFSLCLRAGKDQKSDTVKQYLEATFRTYGLPTRILCDNGSPWSNHNSEGRWTRLGVWLIDLGVAVAHSRPYHPQTLGKDERFHRTLDLEVLSKRNIWRSHDQIQKAFDDWRPVYNHERPHDSLDGQVPADRYQSSTRSMPATFSGPDYTSEHPVRLVDQNGRVTYKSDPYRVGKAFKNVAVELRLIDETTIDIYYRHQYIKTIEIRND